MTETYEGTAYCVKCKELRDMENGIVRVSDSGRRMAQGKCPVCGTKVNRIIPPDNPFNDLSNLYMPPRDWHKRAEDWWENVNFLIEYVRRNISQEILKEVCKRCQEGRTSDNEDGRHYACKQARRDAEIASGELTVHRFADGWVKK